MSKNLKTKIKLWEKAIDPKKLADLITEASTGKDKKDGGRRKKTVKRRQKAGVTKKTVEPPQRSNRRKRRGDKK